ncbi:MAG TPA: hypothetical protein VGT61_12510 [Thermomicrobiales bacterium]|nr:hypothetical protein [Thermomicrobiales bacterium]
MPALDRFIHDIADGYQRHIIDEGKQLQLLILATFLLTFTAVRIITHAIRAGRWRRVFHNLSSPGGTHFHHLVPGILLLLISGYLGIGLEDDTFRIPFAILFGIGAALTLDEFALWLHLEDVYWAKEGRQSIDAVVIAASLIALAILGIDFWLAIGRAIGRLFGLA